MEVNLKRKEKIMQEQSKFQKYTKVQEYIPKYENIFVDE